MACAAVACAAAAAAVGVDRLPKMTWQNSFLNLTKIIYYSVQSVILRGRLRQFALEPLNNAVIAEKIKARPSSPWNNTEGIKE